MKSVKESLIKAGQGQLDLIPSNEMPADIFAAAEKGGDSAALPAAAAREFTAARLFEKKPETYSFIIGLLAENVGMLKIGKLLHVSVNTVVAVRDREGETVDIEKKRISSAARAGARMCLEGIIEDLADPIRRAKISARDKAIIHGVLVEKSELLAGGATSRVEHTDARPTVDDFNAFLDELQVVEGSSCLMDQAGETPGQKALPESSEKEPES